MAGGAEAFRALAASIGRIDRAIASMARLGSATGSAQGQANLASQLRAQLQAASTSPSIIRGIREVLAQGMGGQATGDLQESVKRYNAAIRRVIAARDRESEATQKVSQLTVQRASIFQQTMPALYRALLAGTATSQQMQAAQVFGGARFTNLTQRMQQAQQTAAQQAGIGAQQQRVAGVWAQRGQQAGLGPGGIPQGGGRLAAIGQGVIQSGLGGMGTLVGSLFGPKGAAIGFAFDMAVKSVTGAFKELDKWVREGSRVVSEYARFSQGGVFAAFTLQFEEFKRLAYVSRNLSGDMANYAKAQAANMRAWRDFDVFIERFKLRLATMGAEFQGWIARMGQGVVDFSASVQKWVNDIPDWFKNALGQGIKNANQAVLGQFLTPIGGMLFSKWMNQTAPEQAAGAMGGNLAGILMKIHDILKEQKDKDDALRMAMNHPVKAQFAAFANADFGQMAMRHRLALQRGFGMGQWGPLPGGGLAGGLAGVDAGGLFPRGPRPGGGPDQGGVLGWRRRGARPQIGRGGAGDGGVNGGQPRGMNPHDEAEIQRQLDEEMREFNKKKAEEKQPAEKFVQPPEWHVGRGVDVGLAPTMLPPQDRNVPWQRDIGPDLRMS